MEWTLEYASTTQTFEAWGLEGLAFNFATFAPSSATFRAKAPAFDAASPFARGAAGIIRADGAAVFRGTFGPASRIGQGHASEMVFTLRDAWFDLERRFYMQVNTALPQVNDTLAAMIEAVIDYAASIGVAVQFGTAASLDIQPPKIEFKDQTCAGMLKQLRRFVPDLAHRFDYSTNPPTLHFVRRGDAEALALPISGADAWDALNIESMEDMQATGVYLRYSRLIASGGGAPALSISTDVYPEGMTGEEDGAVVATFDLRGNQVETQTLEVTNIAATSRAWWSQFYDWIAPGNEGLEEGTSFAFTSTAREVQDEDGDWIADTGGHTNQITGGGVPGWLNDEAQVKVTATLNDFTLNGVYHETYELKATVSATSLVGGIYVRETQAAEDLPVALAQAYYEATSVLHFQGSISRFYAELELPLPHPANVINLTGGEATARGWDSMRAALTSVAVDVQAASIQLAFGPPEHLGPQDMLELARMASAGRVVLPQNEPGASTSGGVRRAPNSNTLPPKPQLTARAGPWAISAALRVTPGSLSYGASIMPVIDGVRLDAVTPKALTDAGFTGVGIELIYLKCTWVTTFTDGYLDLPLSLPQGNVEVVVLTAVPTATASVHYIHLATFNNGAQTADLLTYSPLAVTLWDNGVDAAVMRVGS